MDADVPQCEEVGEVIRMGCTLPRDSMFLTYGAVVWKVKASATISLVPSNTRQHV